MPSVAVAHPAVAPSCSRDGWHVNLLQAADDLRRGRRWLLVVFAAYAAMMLLAVPQGIGSSWRECDTQAIARSFLVEGFDPLHPRVDWRGDTSGAVECEFPLFQLMVATVMAVTGEAEWPGRVIALLSMLFAAFSLHRLMEARVGAAGALAGAMVFLTGGHALVLGGRVQPDATSTALALAGLTTYVRFLATGSGSTLLLATLATTFGALAKPTALQIVLVQFLWTALLAPQRLRETRVWAAHAATVGVVVSWLWHSQSLYLETGLTFGVVSGGDTKFPDLEHLLMPELHVQMLRTTGRYGFGLLGGIGLLVMVVRRRFDLVDASLLVMVALGLFGSFRYSHSSGLGRHYHVFAAVAGAWCVARAMPARPGRLLWALLAAAVIGQGAMHAANERQWRQDVLSSSQLPLAAAVEAASKPDELVVVHGMESSFDEDWQRRINFEEPILLYNARRHGWVLALDAVSDGELAALRQRGARLFVDQAPAATPPAAQRWLDEHGELLETLPGGRVYRLTPP
ncbi:MAG: glycosyltransferase family 39 protein [Planctomycetes bacterium]|nr:glycosyltransferase family 39 protein [Planctomycetota bacterium]